MDWIDRAYKEIENDYAEGNISYDEYRKQLNDLRDEIEESTSRHEPR